MTQDKNKLLDRVKELVVILNQKFLEHRQKNFPMLPPVVVEISVGKRYIKLNKTENGKIDSVYAFIDTNGDVLKPASWRAPAKHPRANVYSEDYGIKAFGPYGLTYLRGGGNYKFS